VSAAIRTGTRRAVSPHGRYFDVVSSEEIAFPRKRRVRFAVGQATRPTMKLTHLGSLTNAPRIGAQNLLAAQTPRLQTMPRANAGQSALSVRPQDAVAVKHFFDRFPHLMATLVGAIVKLRSHFPGAPIEIGVMTETDEEGEGAHAVLLVRVLTRLPATEAVARLNDFDVQWWFAQGREAHRLLHISLGTPA
jgi:hypothetical protein